MKEINLHLGVHKTATTYTQDELKLNIEKLKSSGVEYFPLSVVRKNITNQNLRGDLNFSDAVNKLLTFNADKVIISDENLIGKTNHLVSEQLYKQGVENILKFFQHFEGSKIKVIISLRDAAGFLPSMYSEYLRHYKFVSYEEYTAINNTASLNWFNILSEIIKSNPNCEFHFYNFNHFKAVKNQLLEDISFGALQDFSEVSKQSRVTLTAEAIKFLSLFPNKSVEVLKKMERSGYVMGTRFKPYDEEEIALAKTAFETQLKQLSSFANVEVYGL